MNKIVSVALAIVLCAIGGVVVSLGIQNTLSLVACAMINGAIIGAAYTLGTYSEPL
jgi:hypothetical protein